MLYATSTGRSSSKRISTCRLVWLCGRPSAPKFTFLRIVSTGIQLKFRQFFFLSNPIRRGSPIQIQRCVFFSSAWNRTISLFRWKQFEQQSRRQHPVGNPNRLFGPPVTRRSSFFGSQMRRERGNQEVQWTFFFLWRKFTSHPPPDAV